MNILIFSNQHLPVKSLRDAEYVLEMIHSQKAILQFNEGDNVAQFKVVEKEDGIFYEYINDHPSTDIFQRLAFVKSKEEATKELYRLRKHFNKKYAS